jgi:GT2 family glycosyltransferase
MNSGCHMGPQPVWRKEIHSHLGYFDESYRSAADYEFWCRIAIQYPMLHINKFLGVYYHNPAGIVNSNGELSVNETQQIKQKYAHNFPLGNAVPVPDYYYHQPWQGSEYVNIGMVTYNRLEFTRQAIESLVKHTRFPHVISVIDNNSQDGTQQYLTQLYEQGIIKNLILLKENIGVAKASNIAWQCEPDAGYYLKYDNDIIIQKPDWLKNLVEVTNGVKQLGVVGYNFEPVGYELKEIDGFKIRPKPRGANVGGACILIPKKMHDRLGFWCEDYGLYGEEDYDYGIRVTLSGLLNVYMEDEDIGFHLPAGKAAAIDQHSFIAKDGLEESLDKAYREAKDVHRAKNMAPDGPVQKNLEAYQNHPDRVYVATAGLTNDIFNLVFPESLKEQILKHNGQQRAPSISGDESIKANDLDLIQQLGFVSGLEAACQVLITISEITDDSIFNTAVTASATHSKFISKYAVTKDELFLQLAQIVKDKAIEKVEHDQGLLNQALQFLYAIDHQSVYFEKSIALKATVRQLLDDLQYQIWVKNHSLLEVDAELFAERMMLKWQNKPGFHLLMLLFPEEQALLADTLDSLGKQFYQEWGLTVISELPVPDPIFEQEDFLNWVQIAGNDDPYELLNALISDVESDWVAIIEPGATFEPQTFIHIADYINIKPKWKLIYTDEDSLEKDDVGNDIRTAAKFKPDFNLDLLRSTPYMGHFCVVERASLLEMGGFSADFGLENYDAAFRYYENYGEQGVGHISDVLFHQPITSTRRVAEEHIQNIVKRHLQRNLIDADVEAGYLPESCRITYQHQQTPKVSIIIPTKDKLEYLEPCIESLLEKTEYPNFEVIIVDNQSSDPDVVEYYSALKQRHPEKIRVIDYPHPFNFSAICNYAADQAEGEYLLLLNNDTEILHKEWLGRMMMHAMRDDVGAVGARLVYPESGLLQHAGIVMGMDTIADHPFIGQLHIKEPGYMGRALLDQNYSAVTGACLLIEKNIYQSVKGMDEENFAVSYNDVDLCLKTREAGYRVVWTPYSTLVHHGNVTQNSTAASKEKIERFKDEREAMFKKWQPIISEDPAFNRQLSLTQRDFSVEAAMPCNWDVNFHDRLRIFGIPIEGGAGDYRLIQPFNGLRKSGLAQCEYLRLQNNAKDRINVSEIARQKPDVVVFHSSITDTNLKLLEQCRTLLPDIFLIYMIDDLIDQVPKKSSAYRTIKRSFRDAKPRIRRALSNCDRVIVSTEPLAKFCRGMIDDIKIVPNSLERDVWLGLESKRQQGNKLRVGWAGALQHQGDLDMIAEVVKQTASEVDWVFMGMRPESIKPYIKEFHESVDISDYPKVLAGLNLDLAIAPLEDNSFNEAKSNLRLLEYGILGWPVICSDVYPYRGTPVTCVENTTEEWLAAIRQAIDYPDDLPKQGDRLRQWVTADYMLEDNLEYWLNALKPKS